MEIINATSARAKLYGLIDQVSLHAEPVLITGKENNAVLISEDDWRSIQETLYLQSIPGMQDSILKARKEPLSKGSKKLPW